MSKLFKALKEGLEIAIAHDQGKIKLKSRYARRIKSALKSMKLKKLEKNK